MSVKGKAEFLADVVSFANTAGGYMLFGVDEDKGVAIAVPGIELKDTDEYGLRLENMCRDNIEPRTAITGLDESRGGSVLKSLHADVVILMDRLDAYQTVSTIKHSKADQRLTRDNSSLSHVVFWA